ncbi:MAG TPA: hypothetical protein DCQ98_00905 [Planctomycetaceae bacterium]|nr:hypothetical protein [Planctomycetaceae bacterium]HRE99717.1 hypothetical protein [Pirellulaceae bacterium]
MSPDAIDLFGATAMRSVAGDPLGLLAQQVYGGALIVFALYSVVVFAIAIIADRVGRNREFLGEYFLGSRSLGMWAFAMTYAATSASGGTFMGVPALIYTHGWAVGLWIGGYMIVPLVSMGLVAKRMNQVARRTGAITVPDLLRDRMGSPWFGALCTLTIVLFLSLNLIGQFKAGAKIIETLLGGQFAYEQGKLLVVSWLGDGLGMEVALREPGYVLCLILFSLTVIFYTAYGGFRAVVWTDVMQGAIMVAGVLIMLPLTIWAVGGLDAAHRKLVRMTPPEHRHLIVERVDATSGESNDTSASDDSANGDSASGDSASDAASTASIPKGAWILLVEPESGRKRVFRTKSRSELREGATQVVWKPIDPADPPHLIPVIELTTPDEIERIDRQELPPGLRVRVAEAADYTAAERPVPTFEYASGAGEAGAYVRLPGPDPKRPEGFLSLGLAMSFFLMWNFSGSGQPSNMVRLLAFRDSRTLQRAMFTMAVYYAMIYFPLVVIFALSRVLLPGWEIEPDRIMPEMAAHVTHLAGVPWLAGLLLAAPFAAVMSTVDSFLLVNASSIARDLYHRSIDPRASEGRLKAISVGSTVVIGFAATWAALDPPQFLQDMIVYTTSGLSTCFLAPVFLALYWRRFNKAGAFGSMLAGLTVYNFLYGYGYWQSGFRKMEPLEPFGLHPFVVGAAASFAVGLLLSLATAPPADAEVKRFFGEEEAEDAPA